MKDLIKIINSIEPLDKTAMDEARVRQDSLAKPKESLGTLEDISVQLSGITGKLYNNIDKRILFLFGADNGVYEEGVSAAPQNFTNLLMGFYGSDKNCAINVICKHNDVDLKIIDMGVIGSLDYTNIHNKSLMKGSNNFLKDRALPVDIVEKAIEIGFEYAKYASENGYNIIGNGEVGMGNTTTATACIMSALGVYETEFSVGRGAGLSDEGFEIKKMVIDKALKIHKPDKNDMIDILSKVGGLDISAMVGLYIGAAYYKIPIVIDGLISIAAALLAFNTNPLVRDYMIPSHVSKEPAYNLAATKMKLKPILNLGMKLGEGTGCPIAMGVIENAIAIMNNMSTFEEVSLETGYQENIKSK